MTSRRDQLDLETFSEDELKAELARREALADAPPTPLPNPDFTKLIRTVIHGTEQSAKEKYFDSDFDHYVYTEAMTAVYGKAYWDWHNSRNW